MYFVEVQNLEPLPCHGWLLFAFVFGFLYLFMVAMGVPARIFGLATGKTVEVAIIGSNRYT
jgi:hypothetical protein